MVKGRSKIRVRGSFVLSRGNANHDLHSLEEQDVASSSGAYTYGLAQTIKDLLHRSFAAPHMVESQRTYVHLAGDYTLTASAFEPYHTGPYTLKVECSTPFDLKSIPQEGGVMYSKVLEGAWDASSAAGGPAFQKYVWNPRFEFTLPTSGQIKYVILS